MSFFKDLNEKISGLFKKKENSVTQSSDNAFKKSVVEGMIKIAEKFENAEIVENRFKYGKFDNFVDLQKKILKKYFNERIKKLSDAFKNNKDENGASLTLIERGIIADIIKKSRKINPPEKSEEQEKFDKELDEAIEKLNDVIKKLEEKKKR